MNFQLWSNYRSGQAEKRREEVNAKGNGDAWAGRKYDFQCVSPCSALEWSGSRGKQRWVGPEAALQLEAVSDRGAFRS